MTNAQQGSRTRTRIAGGSQRGDDSDAHTDVRDVIRSAIESAAKQKVAGAPYTCKACTRRFPWLHNYYTMMCRTCDAMHRHVHTLAVEPLLAHIEESTADIIKLRDDYELMGLYVHAKLRREGDSESDPKSDSGDPTDPDFQYDYDTPKEEQKPCAKCRDMVFVQYLDAEGLCDECHRPKPMAWVPPHEQGVKQCTYCRKAPCVADQPHGRCEKCQEQILSEAPPAKAGNKRCVK